nr:Armadillo-like helical [Ipomoea batatas]GMD80132.1 Armadillo-like helical [Ipomoea batatas]
MKEESKQVLRILEALKQASKELQTNAASKLLDSDSDSPSPAIKALLELGGAESDSLLAADPQLNALTGHLSDLKSLISTSEVKHGRFTSFLARRVRSHEISRLAGSVEVEIQAWIDRETIVSLTSQLRRFRCLDPAPHEESVIEENLINFRDTLARGFDLSLQDLLLRSRTFAELEWVVCSGDCTKGVRQNAAYALKELVLFNKDVFVGQVLTGGIIKALASMGSKWSMEVLSSLIKAIRSPLVDEIHSNGGIPIIISYLQSSQDSEFNAMAMDCILEIAYFGRKEAIEAMLKEGLIKRLVEMQRSELGGDLIDQSETGKSGKKNEKMLLAKHHPFASCVARFAVQMEVGEGLRQREKRAMKQEVLKRVRETSASDAETATIIAEVLWGSSP